LLLCLFDLCLLFWFSFYLVFALAQLIGVQGDVTPIARLGSGSACRSLFG